MYRIAAVDLGASSGRVLIGTFSGGVVTVEECNRFSNGPVPVPSGAGEELYWDILALWRGVREGLALAARSGPLDAIGIDTWAVDYGLLNSEGALLANPHSYRSDRTSQSIDEVHRAISPSELYRRNGIQFQPFNTMYQVVADGANPHSQSAARALLLPDLLAYWLTGNQVCEVTNASTTGFIDPLTRTWSPELLDVFTNAFGVDVVALFPKLVEPGHLIGTVNVPDIPAKTSAGQPTPVIAVGSHDTASAVAAMPTPGSIKARMRDNGQTTFGYISSGTWSLVGVELDSAVTSEASRSANFTNELGVDGTVRYLANVMGMWVQQQALETFKLSEPGDYSWPTLNAETAAAEPLRTLFDINDSRLSPPGDMPGRIDAMCRESDEPLPRSRGEYLRAITESLVIAYRRSLRLAQELSDTTIDRIHIVGGGSLNQLLCQMTADATGLPVIAGPVEGTAFGNMLVQLRAIGAIDGTLDDLRQVVLNSTETITYLPQGDRQVWNAAELRAFPEVI